MDGLVYDSDLVINKSILNKNDFLLHSFGYGEDFDENLIEKIGSFPLCTHNFMLNINKINLKIMEILDLCCSSKRLNIKVDIDKDKNNLIQYNSNINEYYYMNSDDKDDNTNVLYFDEFYPKNILNYKDKRNYNKVVGDEIELKYFLESLLLNNSKVENS